MNSSEIEWFQRYCQRHYSVRVSPLAITLAQAAKERSQSESAHEWIAANAMKFEYIIRNHETQN